MGVFSLLLVAGCVGRALAVWPVLREAHYTNHTTGPLNAVLSPRFTFRFDHETLDEVTAAAVQRYTPILLHT